MPSYVISADVNGRTIEWEPANGRDAMRFWREMKATRRTPDTATKVFSATLIKDGRKADAIEDEDQTP